MITPRDPDTALGVDVGGTRIRVARIARSGALLERLVEPVTPERRAFLDQLVALLTRMRMASDRAVGIGLPGRVDAARGTIVSAGYLDIAGLDLADVVRREFGLPARVENDATMALVAEAAHRPEGAHGVIMMVTVGTGIGGAVSVDGKPWYGGGFAGQFGHLSVSDAGPPCNCGRRGCVETFSSGTALGRLMAEAGWAEATRADDLIAAARNDDVTARRVLAAWAGPMRRAIESLVAVADPRLVLVGGGLGGQMVEALAMQDRPSRWFAFPVVAAMLGDDAGVIGAGLRAFAFAGEVGE
jgi:glucokinase